jgi:hypothetical protein
MFLAGERRHVAIPTRNNVSCRLLKGIFFFSKAPGAFVLRAPEPLSAKE